MPDESFLEDLFGSPPSAQPAPAEPVPAPAVPLALARPRPVSPPSRRYGLLVTLLVGLTAVPSWIVLRAGLEGVDPDFGARLAGPVQPFVVPGDHLAPPSLRLPERPVRPAPQADPGLAQAAGYDGEEPDEPPRGAADPLLEHQAPVVAPPLRPVWRPVARPPGAVRPVPPPAPADPDPAFPGALSFPGPSFPGPSFPGPSFPGPPFPGPSFPGPALPGGPGMPGGGPLPGGHLPGGPVFPGGPWVPGGHGRPDRLHLPWHWHRHGHGGRAVQDEPCEPGTGGDRGGPVRAVVADGLRRPVLARREVPRDLPVPGDLRARDLRVVPGDLRAADLRVVPGDLRARDLRVVPRDLRASASGDRARPAVARHRQGQRGSVKIQRGAARSAAKREWRVSGDGNLWVAEATHGLPFAARVRPARPERVASAEVKAPEVRTADHRKAGTARGKGRDAERRSGSGKRPKSAEREAGGEKGERQHVRKVEHRKAEHRKGKSHTASSRADRSQVR